MEHAEQQSSLCGVCHLRRAKYICPRCNARYCSLDCYKQHSERCTEGFYRDSATAELKSITATDAEKRQMLEILQKVHEQQLGDDVHSRDGSSSSSDEEEEGAAGLSQETARLLAMKLESGAEISPADLTPQELQAFHRAVAAGEVSEVVQLWQPWWLSEEAAQLELSDTGTALVAEVAGVPGDAQLPGSGLPVPPSLPAPPSRPLPPLSALTKARPSPLLQLHLLDLLYSYCYVLRLYNGDYSSDPAGAADMLFSLSAVLEATAAAAAAAAGEPAATPAPPATDVTAATVLLECISRVCRPPAGSRQQGVAVALLSDVAALLQLGRPAVVTSLMDLSRLLEAAKQQLEAEPGAGKGLKRLKRRLVAAERKLLFFMAWANEQPQEEYSMLGLAVGAELQKHAAAAGGGSGGSGGSLGVGGGTAGAGVQLDDAARRPAAAGPMVQEL